MQLVTDALSVLDSLKVKTAHMVGHSMGGFITQLLEIHYPDRVISITTASALTNSPDVPSTHEKTWEIFMENNPQNDLKGFMQNWEYLNGTAKFDKELAIEYTKNLYTRQEIKGALGASHVKAQVSLTDRTQALKKVRKPTLVLHGEEHYLVNKYGGIQISECIKNSELILIPNMGQMPFNHKILERFENEISQFTIKNSSN